METQDGPSFCTAAADNGYRCNWYWEIECQFKLLSHVSCFLFFTTDFWSKLAVDLALALNGEIINGDAMQMYQGLPIITNKITKEEMCGVPHHLLGVLDVKDVWQVGKFVQEAARIVSFRFLALGV